MSETSKVIKSGVWYIACNFFIRAASFISMPFFTRLMSTDDIGYFSNILSWVNVLVIITSFDLYNSITLARFDYRDELDKYISSILVFGSLITVGFYLIFNIFSSQILSIMSIDYYTMNLIMSYCLLYPALQMFQIKSRCFYKYKASVVASIISTVGAILFSLLGVILFENKLLGRINGYFYPLIISCFFIYIYLLFKGKSVDKNYWGYALRICFPLIWHTLATVLLSSSDRIMITKMCGASQNALYSVAYSCSMVVSILWSSMNTAWSPWAYEKLDQGSSYALRKASKPYSALFFLIVILFILFSPEILLIVGGDKYKDAIYVMPPVMVGYVFQFIYSFYVNIEFYYKKQNIIAVSTIVSSIINIGLNYLFIPKYGYIAAAYTTLVGYIVLFLLHFISVYRMRRINLYDTKFNIISLVGFITLIPVSYILYKYLFLRISLIVILTSYLLIVLYKYRFIIKKSIQTKSINPVISVFEKRLGGI